MKKQFSIPVIAAFSIVTITLPCIGQKLDIEVKTETFGGDHAPKNSEAIWIQSTDKKHIRSLAIWGFNASYALKNWREVTDINDTGVFDTSTFDGYTGATRDNHDSLLAATWDCKDSSGNLVTGDVEFWIDMTESDYWWGMLDSNEVYKGKSAYGTITLDNQQKVVNGDTSDPSFSSFTATYEPTGIISSVKNPGNKSGLSYWYNPSLRELTVKLNSHVDHTIVLHIFNLKGTLINTIPTVDNANTFKWDTRSRFGKQAPAGVYLFEVYSIQTDFRLSNTYSISLIQ